MWLHRPRFEFRVKLTSQKPGMITDFDDLDQFTVRRNPADDHSLFLQPIQKFVVEFIAVAVALGNFLLVICLEGQRMVCNTTAVCAQPHAGAFL